MKFQKQKSVAFFNAKQISNAYFTMHTLFTNVQTNAFKKKMFPLIGHFPKLKFVLNLKSALVSKTGWVPLINKIN